MESADWGLFFAFLSLVGIGVVLGQLFLGRNQPTFRVCNLCGDEACPTPYYGLEGDDE